MDCPISHDAIVRKWPMYSAMLRDRLLTGAEIYGDDSFKSSLSKLLGEVQQELLDVSGWAFILWCRVNDLQQQLMEKKDVG